MRVAAAVLTLLFLFAAAVQWNDPDPARWVALYLAAAVASGLCALRKPHATFSLFIALIATMWFGMLVPDVFANPGALAHIFDYWEMQNSGVEVAREVLGLALVAGWTLAIGAMEVRRLRSPVRAAAP